MYRCTQYGECEKADARELIAIEPGQEPICPNPDCEKPLTRSEGSARGALPMGSIKYIAIMLGVIVLLAVGILFWPHSATHTVTVEDALTDVWPWLKEAK